MKILSIQFKDIHNVQQLIVYAKKMNRTITFADLTILKIVVIKLIWTMRKFIQKMTKIITQLG